MVATWGLAGRRLHDIAVKQLGDAQYPLRASMAGATTPGSRQREACEAELIDAARRLDAALTRAAAVGRLEAVQLQLTRGADINRTDTTVARPHWAAFHGHLQVAAFLVANGARLNLDPELKRGLVDRRPFIEE